MYGADNAFVPESLRRTRTWAASPDESGSNGSNHGAASPAPMGTIMELPTQNTMPASSSNQQIDVAGYTANAQMAVLNEVERRMANERQMMVAGEMNNMKNDVHLVKREVSDLKSMVLQIGLTRPAAGEAAQPVNVVVNTQNNVTQEVQKDSGGDSWGELNKSLRVFFKSPFNRLCFFGTVGFGLYIYNQKLVHTWRMTEMQRRIDTNLFLRMAQWMNGTK